VSFEVVTVGEALLRLWVPPGHRLEDAASFQASVAGAEANVAMAIARMGGKVAWISRLPESPLGRRVARAIAQAGVDVSHVVFTDGMRLGTYYLELSVPPRPTRVIYDRVGSAASAMSVGDMPWEVIEAARLVHISGITPALSSNCREMSREVARRAQAVSVDVNYRSQLWTPSEARAELTTLCSMADLVLLTREDARDVFALKGHPEDVLSRLRDLIGVSSLVLTLGADGAAWLADDVHGSLRAFDAQVVDRVGAGDAFAAGALLGFLDDNLPNGIQRGLAMAAITIGLYGDQLKADPADIEQILGRYPREISR
jgi:2-dehydro-3-deoxygluconokinase